MTLGADIGDGRVARENEILRVIAGSTACGVVADESNSDLDLTGVYIENPEQAVGLERSYEHWVSRTQPEGKRSGKGDVDLTSYALRKFMRLAVVGNPSILITLYVSPEHVLHIHPLGSALRLMRSSIVSQHAPRRFLGYLDSQVGRMMGQGKQSRMPKRPELVEAHGYDVKYAAAALRLGLQGLELATSGHISMPMLDADREACLAVRTGKLSKEEALRLIGDARQELAWAIEHPILQPEADMKAVNRWMIAAHLGFWSERGLVP